MVELIAPTIALGAFFGAAYLILQRSPDCMESVGDWFHARAFGYRQFEARLKELRSKREGEQAA